ncbi:MAG: lipid IV(A) 3-deoxy-D-manno-octulosonic acid transferase [Salinisphaeraceae bacterium]
MIWRHVYSLLLILLLPLVLAGFAWRGLREPGYRRGWGQRLEFGRPAATGGIWVHAASVGEVQVAAGLVRGLAERHPELPRLVTTFTPSGCDRARQVLGDIAEVRLLPFDLPGAMRRFVVRHQPRLVIVVETELWPNMLAACRANGVPVMLANARLSDRSVRRYRRWPLRTLMAETVTAIDRVAAARETDAGRFAELGVPVERIHTTGNLKFDLPLPDDVLARGQALRKRWQAEARPVWVAASTHAGEEALVLEAHAILRQSLSDSLLILVPRHAPRFEAVAELVQERSLSYARHSRGEAVHPDTAVVLGDTLGELPHFYAAADLAFVGGSLVSGVGGHNLLEPAALRLPMMTGLHLGAWQTVADWLIEAGALCSVTDAASLAAAAAEALADPAGRRQAGLAAERVVEDHRGALARTLREVPELLTQITENPP